MKKLKSRKFWVAVASALFIILTDGLDISVPSETYFAVVAMAAVYIFGEAYVDARH